MASLKILQFTIFLAIISTSVKSQEENKCGGCPCNNPCNPPPSPPPPALPPPPPKKKPPPSNYCPPPPSGGGQNPPNPPYIYINGPPGNLYPVDPYYSGSVRSFSSGLMPFLISAGLGLLAIW
ncbi:leucine-rich repeat extensin-like protein 6 [Salvia hispanica]|uniref:leucine-rich repeat extensin-like protein 6 n=1 Tax=Salvia hispanica TaxID=49212 RepID=UPI002009A497|nr:leucine-rich repeat extensin-like protein 6 [Salvia hispanica]